ncbi:MAG: deoxyribodipyrimidine photo-lyase [Microscillaceae bacterium]
MPDLPLSVFWFRRDLRLEDNAGLWQALQSGKPVLPIFIFDRDILDSLPKPYDARVDFLHQTLRALKAKLRAIGTDLWVYYDQPRAVFQQLTQQYSVEAVFTNRDYEPYAKARDGQISDLLRDKGITFAHFKDQCIFEHTEVRTGQGGVYGVFTPYSRRWKALLAEQGLPHYDTEPLWAHFLKITAEVNPPPLPFLEEMGFAPTNQHFPPASLPEKIVRVYDQQRNFPARPGTTRLSIHLRFGTVSIREMVRQAQILNQTWLNELIWRDFYMMILDYYPQLINTSYRPEYDQITWRNNEAEFAAWCEGKTGYPIVDAGMRELNKTGFMHNRVRMITASFLTKHLLVDWRWGERYFAQKLLDFELSSNNGGWQWAAGSGTDAAPYFRIFNPEAQTKKFDPDLQYIKKWVPEFQSLSYKPIVDHAFARQRCLDTYQKALKKQAE